MHVEEFQIADLKSGGGGLTDTSAPLVETWGGALAPLPPDYANCLPK